MMSMMALPTSLTPKSPEMHTFVPPVGRYHDMGLERKATVSGTIPR